jgi:lipoate-protein ligase A
MDVAPYFLPGLEPIEHLALENCLAESSCIGDGLLVFYSNGPSVFIGRNQNPWKEIAADPPVPFFRRTSGGGTVYHDAGNLNWAFIVPRHAHDQDAELESIVRGLCGLGIEVSPGDRGGIFCSGASAFAGRKVSGTARRFTPATVLHHGTVLVAADMALLHASLGGIATVDDHSIASVPASPVNLCELLPNLSVHDVMEKISVSVCCRLPELLPEVFCERSVLERQLEKLASPEWIYRTTPVFSVVDEGPRGTVTIRVLGGLVESILAPGLIDVEKKGAGFLGMRFSIALRDDIFKTAVHG